MNYYPKEAYVLFYDHDKAIESRWSCSAIYALECMDTSFVLRERNAVTAKLKTIVETIKFDEIRFMELTFDYNISRVGPVVFRHIYEEDPSGAFFEEGTSIILTIQYQQDEKITFFIGKALHVLPVLLRIVEQYNIAMNVKNGSIKDMTTKTSKELYDQYIKSYLQNEPFIVQENKHHW